MPQRRLAAFVLWALLVAACGTRLDVGTAGSGDSSAFAVRDQAPAAQNEASGTDVPAGQTAATGPVQGGTRTTTTTGTRQSGGAKAAVPGGNGGATDTGISATEIRVGNVSAITGPIPLFLPMPQAVQAYFRAVNDRGGVYGRKLTLVTCDDELNGTKRQACLKSLVEDKKVFAFVGSISAADENDAAYLEGQLKGAVPDVGGFALSYSRSHSSGHWSPMGALRRELAGTAQWEFIKAKTGWKKPMVFWHNIQISREQGQTLQFEVGEVAGIPRDQVRSAEVSPTQPDYNLQVGQAKANGIDAFFTSMEIASNIKLLRAIDNNRDTTWNPTVHFELATYDPDFIGVLGPRAKDVYVRIPHVPFSEPGFAPLAEYLSTRKKYFPNSDPTSFGLFGWVGARYFVEAIQKAGPVLTRAKLVDVLKTFTGSAPFTAGGLIGPNDNVRVQPFYCHVVTQVTEEGGTIDFRRVSGSGFLCSKTFNWRKPWPATD